MKPIILSTFSAWMVRILAIALNLAGLPLALRALGPSRFGLFLVVLSVGSWIGFAHIGMGRVIANIISRYAHHSGSSVQRFVSTAVVVSGGFNAALFVAGSAVFLGLMTHMPLSDVIAKNYAEFVVSIISLFFALCLWFFLSIFEGIDNGYHQLHRLYLFQLASYGVSAFLLFGFFPQHPSIPLAAYILNLSFLCGSIAHALDVVRRHSSLFVWRFEWKLYVIKALLLSSLDFTIIGMGIGVLFQLATGLIGFVIGPSAIVELGIFMRLMQSYGALIIAFTFPMTSVIASKIAKGEILSARRTIEVSGIVLLTGAAFAALMFHAFANEALALWLKSGVQFSTGFIGAGAILIMLCAVHFFLAAVLIAASDTRQVARLHLIEATCFMALTNSMFRMGGQTGVLLGLDFVMLIGCIFMLGRLRRHHILRKSYRLRDGRGITPAAPYTLDRRIAAAPHNRQVVIRRPC